VCTLAIGFITPPVGLNLYVASAISGTPFMQVARAVWPYVLVLIIALLVITFVPAFSLAFIENLSAVRG